MTLRADAAGNDLSITDGGLDFDMSSLEISDFMDEGRLADGEVISNVMAASCTSCECCCSTS